MTEPEQPKRGGDPGRGSRSAPDDANETGRFRWFDDLMERILPKKDEPKPPE